MAVNIPSPFRVIAERLPATTGRMATDQRLSALQRGLLATAIEPHHILKSCIAGLLQGVGVQCVGVNRFCQMANAAAFGKAVTHTQHGHRLVQGLAV